MQYLSLVPFIFTLAVSALAACQATPTGFIRVTKVTPSYWRATFSNAPFNLLNSNFYLDFYALVDQLENDQEVKVVVFDSEVPDFWISRIDIANPAPPELSSEVWWGNVTRLSNLPLITVASIRGITRGAGVELASALDVRFGSREKAVFNQIEVGFGLTPSSGMALLPMLLGRSRALEVAIGADDVDADTAALYGWINRAIPDDSFESFVDTFARRVAGWDHDVIAVTKKLINKNAGFPTMEEWREGYEAGQVSLSKPVLQERLPAVIKAGLGSNITFEKNLSQETLKFTGDGPF
ncbi:unnamed protein product [Clonostachys rosea f. rosea IK726]|uniref:Uncharacterized protein n=1 Tax=Clonostachys rosea f. rosea IK726 TaxID=1349383 RepID=A0ACA9UBG5_BIOOC|nr:unnamed protein product [Clonostachys rosea f. rosea IK726]